MRLDLNTIDYFISTLELVVLGSRFFDIFRAFLMRIVCGEDRRNELKITTVQLLVDELINELADGLAIAHDQMLGLDVFDVRQRKFLQVV